MRKKNYSQAPLPFMGQKRRWNNEFKAVLSEYNECTIFVDLFGGSGLLSRYAKDARPDATVIYNDYDNYSKRIEMVDNTNKLLADLRLITSNCEQGSMIKEPIRSAVLSRIYQDEISIGVDYITLSASLLFSMKYVTSYDALCKETLYARFRKGDYQTEGYLDGLCVVSMDYKELFERWKHYPNVCFLIDPPYLSTEVGTYTNYWKLRDYLDVLHTLKHTNYVYFTSNKSNLIELCEWLENNYTLGNPFHGARRYEHLSQMNYNSQYTDIMLAKRREV